MYRSFNDGTVEFQLSGGKTGYIDVVDIDLLDRHCWTVKDNSHIRATKNNKAVILHRIIMERILGTEKPILSIEDYVTHLNGNRLDNRRKNLTLTTRSNVALKRKTPGINMDGEKGVYFVERNNGYMVQIKRHGKTTSKLFGIAKYGPDARKIAIQWRQDELAKLLA